MEETKTENRGGSRKGAGRKSKDEELKVVEALKDKIGDDKVIKKLEALIVKGDFRAIQLYFNYRFGKPKEDVTVKTDGFSIDFKGLFNKKSED